MSFLNKIFGSENSDNNNSKANWIPLTTIHQLDEISEKSKEKPAAIFKHSTRCGVSRFVLNQFEKEYNLENKIDLYFLDLLQHRDISNEIASRFEVVHQSPQLIFIKNGIAVYNASHNDISANTLEKFL